MAGWYLVCLLLGLFFVMPFVWMFSSALRPVPEIFRHVYPLSWKTFVPQTWTIQNFVQLLVGTLWPRFLFNTIFVAVVTSTLSVLVNSLAAYAFARMRFMGRGALFAVIIATVIIPFEITALPLYLVVRQFGWLDSYTALIIPFVANALSIFLLRQFFLELPRDLEDAARIDGASPLGVYLRVALPLTWPAHVSVGLINFQASWDAFLWPLIATTSPDVRVLQVAIASLVSLEAVYWNEIFAAVAVAALPPILLFFFLQRFYLRGIAMTGLR